jgi:hypothetical protein
MTSFTSYWVMVISTLLYISFSRSSDYIPAVNLILNKISVATNIFWKQNLKLITYRVVRGKMGLG